MNLFLFALISFSLVIAFLIGYTKGFDEGRVYGSDTRSMREIVQDIQKNEEPDNLISLYFWSAYIFFLEKIRKVKENNNIW